MKRRRVHSTAPIRLALVLLFTWLLTAPRPTLAIEQDELELMRSTVTGGTIMFSVADEFALSSIVGQPSVGTMTDGEYTIMVGFLHAVARESLDCNENDVLDACDVGCGFAEGTCDVPGCGLSDNCNNNALLDECEIGGQLEHNCCEPRPETGCSDPAIEACVCYGEGGDPWCCDIEWDDICVGLVESLGCGACNAGGENDCNFNGVPDDCDVADGTSPDCQPNGVPDECDIAEGTSTDNDEDGVPDECQCTEDEDCDDGIFCNGTETCSPEGFCVCGFDADCNDNETEDSCDLAEGTSADCQPNGVPDECDVAEGTSADENGNGIPDECDGALAPPISAPPPHDRRKNRFLSFLPNNADRAVAFRVGLTAVGPPECYASDPGGDVGMTWWVTEPVCTDTNGTDTGAVPGVDPCAEPNVWRAELDSTPQGTRIWPEDTVHIADCEVIPLAGYEIVAYDGVDFSTPLEVATILQPNPKCWADCVGYWDGAQWTPPNGVVNFDDIQAAVFYFQNLPSAPHRTWVEVDDEGVNMVLNFTDILRIVQGFKGEPYPFVNPGACPPSPSPPPVNGFGSESGDELGDAGFDLAKPLPHPLHRSTQGVGGVKDGSEWAEITLIPDATIVQPGDSVAVDVYAAGVLNLAVYEVALEVSGPGVPLTDSDARKRLESQTAGAGQLVLEDLFVDHARDDFAFGSVEFLDAADEVGGRLGGLAFNGAVDAVEPAYLGTFVFRASPEVEGTFYLKPCGGEGTFLREPDAAPIPFLAVSPVAITVKGGRLPDSFEPRDR